MATSMVATTVVAVMTTTSMVATTVVAMMTATPTATVPAAAALADNGFRKRSYS